MHLQFPLAHNARRIFSDALCERIIWFPHMHKQYVEMDDSIRFTTKKNRFEDKNFEVEWSEVKDAYKSGRFFFRNKFFFPSMVTIVINDSGEPREIWLITNKRSRIVDIIKEQTKVR